MRILRAVLALSLLSIGIAGCTSTPPSSPQPTVTHGAVSDAIELVGLWRVSDAEGESPDTWLRLEAGKAQLLRDCGVSYYSWAGRDGRFIASGGMWDGCNPSESPITAWMDTAYAYELRGDGWVLLDSEGVVVARLGQGEGTPSSPNLPDEYTTAPVVQDTTELHFEQPAPLPSSLTPGDITGRWLTEDLADNPRVYVEFAGDAWFTLDGCNGQQGRWAAVESGLLVTGLGFSTEMGCENIPLASWVLNATSAGFEGDTLVLVDAAGSELVRLVPDVSAASDLSADDLLGRWLAVGSEARPEVFVEFGATEWTASDGCNGQQGTWAVTPTGFIAQGSGIGTQIACNNVPVGSWVLNAASANLESNTLVFVDTDGVELGRLVRG